MLNNLISLLAINIILIPFYYGAVLALDLSDPKQSIFVLVTALYFHIYFLIDEVYRSRK